MRIIATQTGYYEHNNIYLEAGTIGITDDDTGELIDILRDGVSILHPIEEVATPSEPVSEPTPEPVAIEAPVVAEVAPEPIPSGQATVGAPVPVETPEQAVDLTNIEVTPVAEEPTPIQE